MKRVLPLLLVAAMPAMGADPPPAASLAKRGDVVVTVDDLNAALATLPEERRFAFRADDEKLKKAVHTIFVNRMLAQSALESGIDKDPTFQRRVQLMKESMLAQAYMEQFEKSLKMPNFEAKVREQYRANLDRYKLPERVKVRWILVDRQGRSDAEALRRAEEARRKLLANEDFAAVSKEYSNDPSYRANQGQLGPIAYERLEAEVAQAARKLKKGEVSAAIAAPNGYYVVTLVDRIGAGVVPFETAKGELIEAEEKKYVREQIDKRLGEFLDKQTEFYLDNIESLRAEVDREKLRRMHEEVSKEIGTRK